MSSNKKRFLITGGSGLIGSYFLESYSKRQNVKQIIYPSHKEMDITEEDSIRRYFELYQPSVVVHFAAFRNATKAEQQRGDKKGDVWKVNVLGSKNIAKVCKEYHSYLVHISTDYVFSGHKQNPGPYSEKDEPEGNDKLLSWYGVTKREAERAILENLRNASIVRICNITRPGNNPELDYVGKILWLYDQKRIYPMFEDQYLTLTYIPQLVDLIIQLLTVKVPGVFHVSTPDPCTPFQLANYLIEKVHGRKNTIRPTTIDSYLRKNPRRYPKFGGLKTDFTQQKLGLKFMTWQEAVHLYATQIKKVMSQ